MPSDVLSALRDMAYNIELAQQFLAGAELEDFAADLRATYAVIRCLEIISEASRRLPGDLKARHPAIPWPAIAGAGNVYRHDYELVDTKSVWVTVRKELPALQEVVQTEIESLSK